MIVVIVVVLVTAMGMTASRAALRRGASPDCELWGRGRAATDALDISVAVAVTVVAVASSAAAAIAILPAVLCVSWTRRLRRRGGQIRNYEVSGIIARTCPGFCHSGRVSAPSRRAMVSRAAISHRMHVVSWTLPSTEVLQCVLASFFLFSPVEHSIRSYQVYKSWYYRAKVLNVLHIMQLLFKKFQSCECYQDASLQARLDAPLEGDGCNFSRV